MNLPKIINGNKIYEFFIKLKEDLPLGIELITHIKFPEYSISIPDNEEEFFELMNDYNWEDISYISFFIKEKFFLNFDLTEETIQITCEDENMKLKIKELILSSFKEE